MTEPTKTRQACRHEKKTVDCPKWREPVLHIARPQAGAHSVELRHVRAYGTGDTDLYAFTNGDPVCGSHADTHPGHESAEYDDNRPRVYSYFGRYPVGRCVPDNLYSDRDRSERQ